jgi:hypothetical protein
MGLKIVRFMTARLLFMYCTSNLAVFLYYQKERGSIIRAAFQLRQN